MAAPDLVGLLAGADLGEPAWGQEGRRVRRVAHGLEAAAELRSGVRGHIDAPAALGDAGELGRRGADADRGDDEVRVSRNQAGSGLARVRRRTRVLTVGDQHHVCPSRGNRLPRFGQRARDRGPAAGPEAVHGGPNARPVVAQGHFHRNVAARLRRQRSVLGGLVAIGNQRHRRVSGQVLQERARRTLGRSHAGLAAAHVGCAHRARAVEDQYDRLRLGFGWG